MGGSARNTLLSSRHAVHSRLGPAEIPVDNTTAPLRVRMLQAVEEWQFFQKMAGTSCTHFSDFGEQAGKMTVAGERSAPPSWIRPAVLFRADRGAKRKPISNMKSGEIQLDGAHR